MILKGSFCSPKETPSLIPDTKVGCLKRISPNNPSRLSAAANFQGFRNSERIHTHSGAGIKSASGAKDDGDEISRGEVGLSEKNLSEGARERARERGKRGGTEKGSSVT